MKKSRCIIFGGGGFIGSHLVKSLVNKGYSIYVFTLGSKHEQNNLKNVIKHINLIKGDFNDANSLRKFIKPGDIIFDLVAFSVPSSSFASPVDEINKHIYPHVNLFEVAFQKKVKKIIFLSSGGGVYGEKKIMPISELSLTKPISPHSIAKLTIEYYLQYFSRLYRIPILIYRVSNAYGPRQIPKDGFGIIPAMFFNILRKKRPILFDHGKIIRDFIYIDDLTEAIAMSFDKKNKFNVLPFPSFFSLRSFSSISSETRESSSSSETLMTSASARSCMPDRGGSRMTTSALCFDQS